MTYSNVVSICLFIILGGSAYAATMLEDNSVFSRHITDGQVFTRDVQTGNPRSDDFAPEVLSTAKATRA